MCGTRPAPSSGAPHGATQPQSCTTTQAPSGKWGCGGGGGTRPAPSSGASHGATQPQSCTTAQAPSGKGWEVVSGLHPQVVHPTGQLSLRAAPQLRHLQVRGGRWYQAYTLKWCTLWDNPAQLKHLQVGGGGGGGYQTCTQGGPVTQTYFSYFSSFRITPTEVNSRQSSCLTNFLLSGRSVMLEMQRRSNGAKTISHMLTRHTTYPHTHSQ